MIRYEIKNHPCGWLLWSDFSEYPLAHGHTWRECAEKLRALHPGAKLKVNSYTRFVVSFPGHMQESMKLLLTPEGRKSAEENIQAAGRAL